MIGHNGKKSLWNFQMVSNIKVRKNKFQKQVVTLNKYEVKLLGNNIHKENI